METLRRTGALVIACAMLVLQACESTDRQQQPSQAAAAPSSVPRSLDSFPDVPQERRLDAAERGAVLTGCHRSCKGPHCATYCDCVWANVYRKVDVREMLNFSAAFIEMGGESAPKEKVATELLKSPLNRAIIVHCLRHSASTLR